MLVSLSSIGAGAIGATLILLLYPRLEAKRLDLDLEIGSDPSTSVVILDGNDVSEDIRTSRVTASVSAVSAIREVRENLVALQQRLAWSGDRSVVLEGRDIGTVVLPDAEVKVFLTASPEVRARRRTEQDTAAGRPADYDEILAAVVARDEKDSSRAESPLRAATTRSPRRRSSARQRPRASCRR